MSLFFLLWGMLSAVMVARCVTYVTQQQDVTVDVDCDSTGADCDDVNDYDYMFDEPIDMDGGEE